MWREGKAERQKPRPLPRFYHTAPQMERSGNGPSAAEGGVRGGGEKRDAACAAAPYGAP